MVNIATVTGEPITLPARPKPKPIGLSPLWLETHGNEPTTPRPRP